VAARWVRGRWRMDVDAMKARGKWRWCLARANSSTRQARPSKKPSPIPGECTSLYCQMHSKNRLLQSTHHHSLLAHINSCQQCICCRGQPLLSVDYIPSPRHYDTEQVNQDQLYCSKYCVHSQPRSMCDGVKIHQRTSPTSKLETANRYTSIDV
jgi:hypothetical protein